MKSGSPVFPGSTEVMTHKTGGLSTRELFAAMAMQGIIADKEAVNAAFRALSPDEAFARVAESSVRYADALIAELAKYKNADAKV